MTEEINPKDAKCTSLSMNAPIVILEKSNNENEDFQIEAYTGVVVDRWWGKLAIDVDGIKAKKQMPIFRDHNRGNIVGYSTRNWKDKSFFVAGKFSQATQHAVEVKALASEGFPWQASIGVMPNKILQLEEGASHKVNGYNVKGPAEIWLETEVFETSFVPLGADDNTSVSVFSKFEEAEPPSVAPAGKENKKMDSKELQEKHPDLYREIFDLGAASVNAEAAQNEGVAAGAEAERLRIKGVSDQMIPGHEKLVGTLMWDGKTTPEQAAVKVLNAEKQLRIDTLNNHSDDAPDTVPPLSTDTDPGDSLDKLPVEEKCKAMWEKDAKIRDEYDGDYETFLAYEKAVANGNVRVLKK